MVQVEPPEAGRFNKLHQDRGQHQKRKNRYEDRRLVKPEKIQRNTHSRNVNSVVVGSMIVSKGGQLLLIASEGGRDSIGREKLLICLASLWGERRDLP